MIAGVTKYGNRYQNDAERRAAVREARQRYEDAKPRDHHKLRKRSTKEQVAERRQKKARERRIMEAALMQLRANHRAEFWKIHAELEARSE